MSTSRCITQVRQLTTQPECDKSLHKPRATIRYIVQERQVDKQPKSKPPQTTPSPPTPHHPHLNNDQPPQTTPSPHTPHQSDKSLHKPRATIRYIVQERHESLTVPMHTQVSTTEIMRHDASDKSLSLSWNSHRQSSSVRKARNGGAAVGGCGGPGAGRLREAPMGKESRPADEALPLPHSSGNSSSTCVCANQPKPPHTIKNM
jgi:hypothetical protein